MSETQFPRRAQAEKQILPAPSYEDFTRRFGDAFPAPDFLEHQLGRMAVYELAPRSGQSVQHVVIVHGANTPALGMLSLARELQKLSPDAHIVFFDLWGHGLSDTPVVPHTPEIFHSQILHVLAHMQWTKAHLVGFSYGGSTAITFSLSSPSSVESVAVLAPGGLIKIDHEFRTLLFDKSREEEALNAVFDFLEGGPLVVPADWREQMRSGQVVAQALREWELQEHAGYRHSILSMFIEGGVLDREKEFAAFAHRGPKHIVVLADQDEVCTEADLRALDFKHIEVVRGAGHDFVRTRPAEVAAIVQRFWSSL